jgi:hypothetical protein
MPASYETEWNPKDYLRQYYAADNVSDLVAPGGTFITAAVYNGKSYSVIDHQFTVAPIEISDFNRVLGENDFNLKSIKTKVVPIQACAKSGFDCICMVKAEKN